MVLLKTVGVYKYFPGVVALSNVDFELEEGEIHGLVGGNGAGKTTFLKILNGIIRKNKGEIYLKNKKIEIEGPSVATEHGIILVRQIPSLFPNLNVKDNVMIRQEITKKIIGLNFLNEIEMARHVQEVFKELGVFIPLELRGEELTASQCKFVEIARALVSKPSIICFDEPTSAMDQSESERFFKIVKELKKQGKSLIYVTHRMPEVFKICDKITVFRDGKMVCSMDVGEVSQADVVEAMTGKRIARAEKIFHTVNKKKVLLEVRDLRTESQHIGGVSLKDINFQVHPGEIVAIAGAVGAGKTELAKVLMGIIPLKGGELFIKGKRIIPSSPMKMIKHGFMYLPEDFMVEGLFPNWAVCENISVLSLDNMLKLFWIDRKKEKTAVESQVKNLNIKPQNLTFPALNLSGGNKKKVILARGLLQDSMLFIIDEPTMGVDISTKSEFRKRLQEIAKNGISVLILSSDFEDTLIADKVIVLYEGETVVELEGSKINVEKITKYAMKVVKNEKIN